MFTHKKKNVVAFPQIHPNGNSLFLSALGLKKLENIVPRINQKDEYLRTPLHRAIECEADSKTLSFLLTQGADPNPQDDNGNTPLHYAAQNGNLEAVKILLNHNANPHLINAFKKNALCDINASNQEHPLALYETLLKHGSRGCFWEHNHDISETFHRTLIHLAGAYFDPKKVDFDSQQNTILHWACYYGQKEGVEALLEKGSPIDLQNLQNKTPFMIAKDREDRTLQDLLEAAASNRF